MMTDKEYYQVTDKDIEHHAKYASNTAYLMVLLSIFFEQGRKLGQRESFASELNKLKSITGSVS